MASTSAFARRSLHVAAIVSLPAVTFSLGGTVAKTSFVVVQKQEESREKPLYVALAQHVGFVKRGKKRADDPRGNDLVKIADEFGKASAASAPLILASRSEAQPELGRLVGCWRGHDSFVAARLWRGQENGSASRPETPLSDLVETIRAFKTGGPGEGFHVSILDVDATGLIDLVAARRNQPMSKGLACQPGDILVSCLNPKIWRVAVIPNLPGSWSCSPEFVVLRPKTGQDSWQIALALHHRSVVQAAQAMAKGTSSSRQRVPKDRLLSVGLPEIETPEKLAEYVAWREDFYARRLSEAQAYDALHKGADSFHWGL